MIPSVRVERTSDLPGGQIATIEFLPDGTVVYRMDGNHISEVGAEAFQTLMIAAREVYHQAWDLPTAPAPALTH